MAACRSGPVVNHQHVTGVTRCSHTVLPVQVEPGSNRCALSPSLYLSLLSTLSVCQRVMASISTLPEEITYKITSNTQRHSSTSYCQRFDVSYTVHAPRTTDNIYSTERVLAFLSLFHCVCVYACLRHLAPPSRLP